MTDLIWLGLLVLLAVLILGLISGCARLGQRN